VLEALQALRRPIALPGCVMLIGAGRSGAAKNRLEVEGPADVRTANTALTVPSVRRPS